MPTRREMESWAMSFGRRCRLRVVNKTIPVRYILEYPIDGSEEPMKLELSANQIGSLNAVNKEALRLGIPGIYPKIKSHWEVVLHELMSHVDYVVDRDLPNPPTPSEDKS